MEKPALPGPLEPTFSNCEREPIHIPGFIQEYGTLVCLNESSFRILQISENAASQLGYPINKLLNHSFEKLLPAEQKQNLETFITQHPNEFTNPLKLSTLTQEGSARHWNGFFHRHDGMLILELETLPSFDAASGQFHTRVQSTLSQIQRTYSLQQLCEIAVFETQRISGYDRVMIYRFDSEWNGKVIAEKRGLSEGIESFLGHQFPASDIPPQARAVFLSNWMRMIPDTEYQPIPILPILNPETGRPLDLSHAFFRSVSPIHIQYLKNMRVGASLTVSLIHEGKLWGLIACHHRQPRNIPIEVRAACRFIGKLISSQLGRREEKEDLEAKKKLIQVHQDLAKTMNLERDLVQGLVNHSPDLLDLTSATGAAVHFEGKWSLLGNTPSRDQIDRLATWLADTQPDGRVFHTDCLTALWPEGEVFKSCASGVMAISILKSLKNYVMWFKPEVLQTVTWAGNPRKNIERLPDGTLKIEPRASFEAWKETVRNKSLPWYNIDFEAAIELKTTILTLDLQRRFAKEQEARAIAERLSLEKENLIAMVSHDLKNPLAAIRLKLDLIARRTHQLTPDSPEQIRKDTSALLRSTFQMEKLIVDLLDVAKIENGTFVLDRSSHDLKRLIDDCIELLLPVAQEKQTKLSLRTSDISCQVNVDSHRLNQVLSNLIGNALKFTPKNGSVTVAFELAPKQALVSISDTGPGIPSEHIPFLFDRFWQARKTHQLGTGLGLSIAKSIVESHGGQIWVESTLDQGTTFFFTLPL